TEMPQKLIPNQHTINSKQFLRFSSVRYNRLKNKRLAEYLRIRGNDLATVPISAICGAVK
ncbi:hypothetical protein QUW60_15020, partial [Bacteroides gallinaceum]|nr:hypothetical protein [Bacteroides gallinaceum]